MSALTDTASTLVRRAGGDRDHAGGCGEDPHHDVRGGPVRRRGRHAGALLSHQTYRMPLFSLINVSHSRLTVSEFCLFETVLERGVLQGLLGAGASWASAHDLLGCFPALSNAWLFSSG